MVKLLGMRMNETETFTQFSSRILSSATNLQNSIEFINNLAAKEDDKISVKHLIEIMSIYTAINHLNAADTAVSTLQSNLRLRESITPAEITTAFASEDLSRQTESNAAAIARAAATHVAPKIPRKGSNWGAGPKCEGCNKTGHKPECCWVLHPELTPEHLRTKIEKQKGNLGKDTAINASLRTSTPIPDDADSELNADTGAPSSKTPHKHWFQTYSHRRVPIHLADDKVIYLAGIGDVVFEPLVNGVLQNRIVFPRVLLVPDIRNNLLSVLSLTSGAIMSMSQMRECSSKKGVS